MSENIKGIFNSEKGICLDYSEQLQVPKDIFVGPNTSYENKNSYES